MRDDSKLPETLCIVSVLIWTLLCWVNVSVNVAGKCDPKGVLAGSNAAVMSVEFDLEVA